MKKLLILLMSLFLVLPVVSSAEQPISVYINGQKQSYSQPPVMQKGSALVPLRGIFESLGASVDWNGSTQTVTATKSSTKIILKIGSKQPTVNGTVKAIDVPGKVLKGSTMVPLRFVSEALGADVKWDGSARKITIVSAGETAKNYDVVLEFPADKYPETAAHIKVAIAKGESAICTVDRDGAEANRDNSLAGIPTKDGYDRDEWPMAMCAEGGEGADIAYVTPTDNRGAGSWVSNQIEQYKDGTRVMFKVVGNSTAKPQPVIPTTPTKPATPTQNKPSVDLSKDDYNCSDFKTQAEAQAVFEAAGGMKGNDPYRLDTDGDLKVCESLR